MRNLIIPLLIALLFAFGCSGNAAPPAPDVPSAPQRVPEIQRHHVLYGMWQGIIDPDAGTIEFAPLRAVEFHLNALPFLEPPALVFLTLETLHFNGDIIDADIGLRHPFLGLNQFTGFDVCGIFIGNGSASGFTDGGIAIAGETNTRLLNPDGHSRWWNPSEFPVNTGTIFGYNDGLLGAPDDIGNFSATLNGYKYFCDDLDDPDDPMSDVTLENRGLFSAGQKNVRHYTIFMGDDGLVFNYAVDASWQFPSGDPPYVVPDDFAIEANRAEAWRIDVDEVANSLYNTGTESGGGLSLAINVYDWQDATLNSVRVESPGNFAMLETWVASGGGEGFSTYEIDITDATPGEGSIDVLVSVISEEEDFEGFIEGTNSAAYLVHSADVASEPPYLPADPVLGNVWLDVDRNATKTITGMHVSWIDNGEPYFAVYADDDPYDAAETWDFVTEVELTTAQIDITNMPDFSASGAYYFTVRARSVSGMASTDSANSELCFIEMEDFDNGDNPNAWTIGYKDASVKWAVTPAGQIDGSASLRIDVHPQGYWSVIISDPLPAIPDSELSYIEFAHLTTTHWHYSAFTSYSIGHSTTPPPQGTASTYTNFDCPNDFYVIMDGTYNWVAPATGPPPDYEPGGGWIPLVEYFGWNESSKNFGWRLHDGPHGAADMSRVRHDWYRTLAPSVRAGLGYGTSAWDNLYDWGEFDEIAVVIY